jgi:uncharacterized protein
LAFGHPNDAFIQNCAGSKLLIGYVVFEERLMKELVEYIVKSIVDNPDEVHVTSYDDNSATTLELSVAADDMGRVIGKNGRVINSIRTLVQVSAAKEGKHVNLEVLEADRD